MRKTANGVVLKPSAAKKVEMRFRTEYEAERVDDRSLLNPECGAVLIGSCFSDYVGERMRRSLWDAVSNPCGVLYNPASIAAILHLAIATQAERDRTVEASLFEKDGIWLSWLFDSSLAACSRQEAFSMAIGRLEVLGNMIRKCRTLIITFGTCWIYELADTKDYIVANCHKVPASAFLRRRMTLDEIHNIWMALLSKLHQENPDMRAIFTVSPVRHLKDGFEGNARSKALLLLACESICDAVAYADYFPAFEIITDDLRDYRFYASDLVHPSDQAVEYVWRKFCERYLSSRSRQILAEGEKVLAALSHRPIIRIDTEKNAAMEAKAKQSYAEFIASHPGMLHI